VCNGPGPLIGTRRFTLEGVSTKVSNLREGRQAHVMFVATHYAGTLNMKGPDPEVEFLPSRQF
jgi:hypothetical protein